ncbi:MAG: COX15/CtaA family protein [Deltaproteobacteria bacterium]|nr:COX15/CtaA family protein [Deltaproteobacteria bacterium]
MSTYAPRLGWVLAGLVFLLVVGGGAVHATGSSLACPDWPLCYGEVFPAMKGGVLFEHSHRLLATAVGLLTLWLAIFVLMRMTADPRIRRYGFVGLSLVFVQVAILIAGFIYRDLLWPLLALVIALGLVTGALAYLMSRRGAPLAGLGVASFALVAVQGMLGGLTVVLKLPLFVSAAHLALSLVFMGVVIVLSYRLGGVAAAAAPVAARGLIGVATLGVYLQAVLGGLVRHSGAGLACNVTVFTCGGTLLPDGGPAWLNLGHRIIALGVCGLVMVATARWHRRGSGSGRVRFLALGAASLAALQLLVGALTVMTFVAVVWVVLHLAIAALLFAATLMLYVELGRPA